MAVSVTYNSKALPNVFGPYFFHHDYARAVFRCNFLVQEATSAALVAECGVIEAAMRLPYEDLTVVFDSTTEYSFSHDGNTGFLTSPSVSIIENELATETSRAYQFELNFELPADKAGFDFRREASFSIEKGQNNRRIVVFNYLYTAGGGKTSRENFETFAEPFATGILSGIGGSYDRLTFETGPTEHEEKLTSGRITFQEVLDDEKSSTFNSIDIVNADADYSVSFAQDIGISDNGYQQIPDVVVDIRYNTKVNKETITSESAFESLYRTEIKPHIIEHSFDILGLNNFNNAGTQYISLADVHHYNRTQHELTAYIQVLVPQSLTQIVQLQETIEEQLESGKVFKKLWDGLAFTYAIWEMGAQRLVARTTRITQLGTAPAEPARLNPDFFEFLSIREIGSTRKWGIGSVEAANEMTEVLVFERTFIEQYLFVLKIENEESTA